MGWFLYKLFKRVSFNRSMKDDLRRMQRQGTVVYAIKYRGQLDYLLYHYNFRKSRLPYPKLAFDLNISMWLPLSHLAKVIISQLTSLFWKRRLPNPYESGFYKDAIQQRTTSLIFLVDPKGFVRNFIHAEKDHLHFLLETQKEMERPVFIVPQLILFKMTPEKDYASLASIFFGFKDDPGFIRKIVLFFRHNRKAFIDFGRPINLKTFLEEQPDTKSLESMAVEIRQLLIQSIDKQKRVILGPIMKSRQQFKEIVLMDEGVNEKIEKLSLGNERAKKQLRKKAGEYFDETAADYNITYVQFFNLFLPWLWKKIFDGIDVDIPGLARVRESARSGTLIFVPSHKSHIDYLVLNYVLFRHYMHIPRVAAGKNLTFWPMGYIFRKAGAFFVRRSFGGAKLYSEVFSRYVKALLEEGHPIEFFIEGGRSRNGKLVLPKFGFLSILLRAFHEGFCEDLIFVPTSIIYDRIIEEKSYIKEMGGSDKERESLGQIFRARNILKRRYGKIYLRFNQPLSFKEYLSKADHAEEGNSRQLAFHLIRAINEVSLVTPLSLVATAILTHHRRGFNLSELSETAAILIKFLKTHNHPVAGTLSDPAMAIRETLTLLINWKIVNFFEDVDGEEEGTFYYVDDEKKIELEYYKNSIIHFFIVHSLVAISLLSGKEEVKKLDSAISDFAFLKNLFKYEFVFDEAEGAGDGVLSLIEYFLDSAYLTSAQGDEGYKITKLGFDKLPIWAALGKTFLESYWIAARSMSQKGNSKGKKGDILKNMDYLGNRFHKLGIIQHIGALSQLNYKNAMTFINENISRKKANSDEEDASALENLSQFGQRLYDLLSYRS